MIRRGPSCAGSSDHCSTDFEFSDLGSFGGLGDLFSSIFGRKGAEREDQDDTVETTLAVPFRVAALGGQLPVTLAMAEVCPTCSGRGAAPGPTDSPSSQCQ